MFLKCTLNIKKFIFSNRLGVSVRDHRIIHNTISGERFMRDSNCLTRGIFLNAKSAREKKKSEKI